MACKHCEHRGFTESWTKRGGAWVVLLGPCRYCNDEAALNARLQEGKEFGDQVTVSSNTGEDERRKNRQPAPVADIIPFRPRGNRPE